VHAEKILSEAGKAVLVLSDLVEGRFATELTRA
jgi:hypothetical protein